MGSQVREGGRGRTHHEEEEEADDEPDEAALVPLGRVVAHLVPLLVPVPFLGAHARARALARVGEGDEQERLYGRECDGRNRAGPAGRMGSPVHRVALAG